jgi:uncharacterized C2H2 Zn-finger protein
MVTDPREDDAKSDLQCPNCGRLFESQEDLRAHVQQEHDDHPLAFPPTRVRRSQTSNWCPRQESNLRHTV